MKIHLIRDHSDKNNCCDICGIVVKNNRHFLRHLEDRHSISEFQNFECKLHNAKFKRHDNYIRHLKSHDLEITCNLCGKIFSRVDNLERHKRICYKVIC